MVSQQMAIKGLVAVKFFIVAAWLGPQVVGWVTLVLLILNVLEELTNTGLMQAGIHSPYRLTVLQAGAWIALHILRGALMTVSLLVLAFGLSEWQGESALIPYLSIAALIPLVKAMSSPGLVEASRQRKFGTLMLVEGLPYAIDLLVTLLLLKSGGTGHAVVWGVVARESMRMAASWILFPLWGRPHFRWRTIDQLIDYGKWITKTSILIVVLNQLDKLIVAVMLGTFELGIYQTASKIAQLLVTDVPAAYGQYLLPVLSDLFKKKKEGFLGVCRRSFQFVALWVLMAIVMVLSGALEILMHFLGKDWNAALDLIPWMLFPMSVGAFQVVAVTIAYAVGLPSAVTKATRLQFLVLALFAPLGIFCCEIQGLILSLALAGCLSFAVILKLSDGRVRG